MYACLKYSNASVVSYTLSSVPWQDVSQETNKARLYGKSG